MGKRLTRIYTRTGDDGTTGLADGSRLPKDSLRIETMGAVDELNSQLGMLRAYSVPAGMDAELEQIQQRLFDIGGEMAMPEYVMIHEAQVEQLEQWLTAYNESLPPLKEFILPGGSRATAACHMARAICRRVERQFWQLSREESINPLSLIWLNRLSDLLFVQARVLGRIDNGEEVFWQHERPEPMKKP